MKKNPKVRFFSIRLVLFVAISAFLTQRSHAQVVVNLLKSSPVNWRLNEAMGPVLINTQSDYHGVYLLGKLANSNGEIVGEFKSNLFTLKHGTIRINIEEIGLSSVSFKDAQDRLYYDNTGCLLYGYFRFCVYVMQIEEPMLGEGCLDYRPMYEVPPRLTYPSNASVLKISPSTLTWLPVVFSTTDATNRIQYSLSVAEVFDWQSPAEALNANPEVLASSELPYVVYNVPTPSQNFQAGKNYVWQVKAWKENTFIGESELWTFSIAPDTTKKIVPPTKSYAILSKESHTALYFAYGALNFRFTGKYQKQQLHVRILNSDQKDVMSGGQDLFQDLGENAYAIDLASDKQFKHLGIYTLEVIDEIGEHYFLRFQYIDPYKD